MWVESKGKRVFISVILEVFFVLVGKGVGGVLKGGRKESKISLIFLVFNNY